MSVRLGEDPKVCLLIVIGVREDGEKELLAVQDGYRESTESWASVFRNLKRRGLSEPKLVVGDGALGAWAGLRDVFPGAGEQRCWFHASGNVIDCLPKRLHSRAKGLLSEIIEAPTRRDAKLALEVFREEYGAKFPKARAKLDRDWTQLTAFFDYPAEHWRHLRTTDENVKGPSCRMVGFRVVDPVAEGAQTVAGRLLRPRSGGRGSQPGRFWPSGSAVARRRRLRPGVSERYASAWAWSTPERSAGSGTDACRAACPAEGL